VIVRRRMPADVTRSGRAVRIAAAALAGTAPVFLLTQRAFANAPKVTMPSGPFRNGQNIAVSGSGFPTHAQDPTGLQIIECSDPQGSETNLPSDPSEGCEGITVNPSQINADSSGRFHTDYLIAALSTSAGTSSIDCDATHECVLWVGTDYNNAFLTGPHVFTPPFTVSGAATSPSATSVPPSGGVPAVASAASGPGTAGSAVSGGSLASTGLSGLVVWLVGLGVTMACVGLVGRRLTIRSAPMTD